MAIEVMCVPHGAVLGKNLRILEVARIPVDVIVEKVTLVFGDAGVERILGPGDLPDLSQEAKTQGCLRIDSTQTDKLQRLAREVAVKDIRSDRKSVRGGIVRYADKFRRLPPPLMMPLGFPTGQRPAILDEGRGVEIANTANVGIESETGSASGSYGDPTLPFNLSL